MKNESESVTDTENYNMATTEINEILGRRDQLAIGLEKRFSEIFMPLGDIAKLEVVTE